MLNDFQARVVVFNCTKILHVSTTHDLYLNSTPGFCFLASILVFQKGKNKIPN